MPAALIGQITAAWLLLWAPPGPQVQSARVPPFRKTDLVRLLTAGTLGVTELASLVRRRCLSFSPTSRDRADLVSLGADTALLRAIDGCARRAASARPAKRAATRAAPSRPSTPTSALPAAVAPPAPRRAPLSGARTGFVLGVGQRGPVGTRPPLPLVFEVRDTSGAPVPGEVVALSVVNGRLGAGHAVADSAGRVQVDLILGSKVGPTVVRATVRALERQATMVAQPGPAARLLLRCGDTPIEGRVTLTTKVPAVLQVAAQDAFGNAAAVTQLRVATGDRDLLRVALVSGDSLAGLVQVIPGQAGSTSLTVAASGQREAITAVVLQIRNTAWSCP